MSKTLWQLLSEQKIEIPIIQRDYAQGRIGKEYLRQRFIGSLVEALDKKRELSLDFVYGTIEDGSLQPLDGQQRLTTLWLLHWYIAVKCGQMKNNADILRRFTYTTRIESKDFCESLCAKFDADDFNLQQKPVAEYIKDQTWYLSKYNLDPTIQGMLRTLNGTNITNTKDEDITDGIEEFFKLKDNLDYENYWKELTSSNCPITFEYKDLKDKDMPLSYDLYIKMNARGKQLTSFENFKAELIDYTKDGIPLIDTETASLIDNEWTDVFWVYAVKNKTYKVDDIYFAFLRRYFLNAFITNPQSGSQETIEDSNTYKELYSDSDTDYTYKDITPFIPVLTEENIKRMTTFFSNWKNSGLIIRAKFSNPVEVTSPLSLFLSIKTDKGTKCRQLQL